MKAVLSPTTEKPVLQAGQTTSPGKAKDALWSTIRRLTDRVQSLELAASATRRDLARISKAQYRAKDDVPPSQENEALDQGGKYNPGLFGE